MKAHAYLRTLLALVLAAGLAGCDRDAGSGLEVAYVAAQQVTLRDRVAAVYNKVGVAKNGEKVVVLERSRRFVRVRSERGEEGWVEQRYLASRKVFDQMQQLATGHARDPSQGVALARADVNMHVTPARDSDYLYRMAEGEKVEVLRRASVEKPGTRVTPKDPSQKVPPPVMEDWRLVRNARKRVGWVLARLIDIDVPLEVAQYAEGQRIIAYFVLNEVDDSGKKVPQYLLALSEPKDGLPYDFNQIRLFTWNPARDRYETAYRERRLDGVLPVTTGKESFDKEGALPTFTLRVRDEGGQTSERKYKLNGVMVRRVRAPGEEQRPQTGPALGRRRK